MKEERITYEEFMIMFKNAPRIAYTLYDKAEDEIERLNNVINELEKYINEEYTYDEVGMKIFDASTLQDKLKELKEEKNEQK